MVSGHYHRTPQGHWWGQPEQLLGDLHRQAHFGVKGATPPDLWHQTMAHWRGGVAGLPERRLRRVRRYHHFIRVMQHNHIPNHRLLDEHLKHNEHQAHLLEMFWGASHQWEWPHLSHLKSSLNQNGSEQKNQPDLNSMKTSVELWWSTTWFRAITTRSLLSPSSGTSTSRARTRRPCRERELFHMIPDEQRAGYADALAKEWQTWCKYQAVAVLDTEASAHVLAHVSPERILATRVCYRNKNAAFPWMPIKYKARIVCRGDRDPDLLTLRRDAPTLARLSLMLICQLAASMVDWFMFNADITGAFLQGDQSLASRREPLYLRQPREGLPGLHRDQLMLIVRGIFGLANSPRLFWRHLRDSLLQLGFRQSMLDKALFLYYKNGQLILAIGVHVGDLIGTGKPGDADEILKKIRETFNFGAWADDREEKALEYGGISRSHVKVVWSDFPRRSSSRLLLCLLCQSGGHRHQVQHWCRTRWRRWGVSVAAYTGLGGKRALTLLLGHDCICPDSLQSTAWWTWTNFFEKQNNQMNGA